ncbi:hypothetical protein SNL152K_10327 [Streptomyces sp. NL15-2K]|nr:hypothetical protein SNL152K_10327 [Streptomyces sp. NL15-2K]
MAVRYGKSSKGTPPKRRTVLLVPEMDWVVDVLDEWVHEMASTRTSTCTVCATATSRI